MPSSPANVSAWSGFGLETLGLLCLMIWQLLLNSPPWGGNISPHLSLFPACYKYFSTSGTVLWFHSARSIQTGLKMVAKNSLVAQPVDPFKFPSSGTVGWLHVGQLVFLTPFLCFLIPVSWFSGFWRSLLMRLLPLFLLVTRPDVLQGYHSSFFSGPGPLASLFLAP